jgi:hypothetical protein
LAPAEFGVFAVLMGVLIAAAVANISLIGTPLMVISGKQEDHELAAVALGLTLASIVTFSVVVLGATVLLGRPELFPAVFLALVGSQLQETLRRALMGRLQFRKAISGDATSYLGQAAVVAILAITGHATLFNAFVAMGLTSLAATGLQLTQVRPSFRRHDLRREVVLPFWRLGRTFIVVNGIGQVTILSFQWLLLAFHGEAIVGSWQALITVLGFTNPLMLAVNSIVTMRVAGVKDGDPARRSAQEVDLARRYGLLIGVPFLAYCVVLLAIPGLVLRIFFGQGSAYSHLGLDLRLLVVAWVAQFAYFVLAGVLAGREDTRSMLLAQAAAAVTVPILGLPLIAAGSLREAVVVMVISSMVRSVVAVRRVHHRHFERQ